MKPLQKDRAVLSRDIRNYIYVRDKGVCEYCGTKVQPDFFHVDHIVPFVKGGADTIDNLVLSCAGCNQTKKARLLPIEKQQTVLGAVIKRNKEMDNKPTPLIFIESRKRPAKAKTSSFGFYRHTEGFGKSYVTIAQLQKASELIAIKTLCALAGLDYQKLRRKLVASKELDLNESKKFQEVLEKHGIYLQ